ncbi:MAG: hypothetical protein IMY76_07765 [Chloroflexi bacterium]|nr:hypothetical protein [Chloroflexota bacterium]
MSRSVKLILALLLVFAITPAMPALAQTEDPSCDYYGTHANGAIYCIEMPPEGYWNGDLVVFAHGYVPITEPVGIPWPQMMLADGPYTYMPDLINSLGYAFATTSYSVNGLAVERGRTDILDLMEVFNQVVEEPNRAYLVGASEGALITTLIVEKHPGVFDGGMALCGPIGDFNEQINYWGNFRVAFDHYMPSFLPPSPVNIPQDVMDNWDGYALNIGMGLSMADPATVATLLAVTGAPIDPFNPGSIFDTVLGILWYNVFATNNGIEVLRGQPFDNLEFEYLDPYLNAIAPRFSADKKALGTIEKKYETSGALKRPFLTMHTTLDPIVPYWHITMYAAKVSANSKGGPYMNIPVDRYGHCNFTTDEIMGGFLWLVSQP